MDVVTFGHGTAGAEEITRLLRDAGVEHLVDVRTAPGSRHNPQVGRGEMERWLPESGIDYRWEKRLGGWRKDPPDSPDTALRNRSFGGYAAHMRSDEFAAAVADLITETTAATTTVMCSESVWWRCHRKLLADFLQLTGTANVRHLMHDGKLREHRPSPEARLLPEAGLLVYDLDSPG